jgi:hypothetical protein
MMVLSFVPSRRDASPLEIESADNVRRIVDRMEGNHRLLIHGRVNPNQPGDIEDMPRLRDQFGICAWKCYTQWGPDGNGFYLDDEVGIRFVEEARRLGVKVICVHKGLPFGPKSYEHSQCRDIGPIAKRFPGRQLPRLSLGLRDRGRGETLRPGRRRHRHADPLARGKRASPRIERLRRARQHLEIPDAGPDAGRARARQAPEARRPGQRAWGTDSIWYGSPQDQIQAFRAFQIAPELREKHGYPAITPELRAKIFGLNAMRPYGISAEEMKLRARRDTVSAERLAYRARPEPHFLTNGRRRGASS